VEMDCSRPCLVVAVLWVLPGSHAAATQVKHDWQGIVANEINIVQSDEAQSCRGSLVLPHGCWILVSRP
jgi:hypothetical protein